MVLGAMAWLTSGVLASERDRARAQARADLEECTRLALWRMDATGAAIVAGENRHLPTDYQPGSNVFPPNPDSVANLHFELRENGKLLSPESPVPTAKLQELRGLLGKSPIPGAEWCTLNCAADASKSAWSSLPKDAPEDQAIVMQSRQSGSRASNRVVQSYQTNFNNTEKAQRAKSVEETVGNSSNDYSNSPEKGMIPNLPQLDSESQITDLGAMRAIRIGDELFLLRQFSISLAGTVQKGVQGVWLDQEKLKKQLLGEVKDLLPIAGLADAPDSAADPLALVSFPFRIVRNEGIPAGRASFSGPVMQSRMKFLLSVS